MVRYPSKPVPVKVKTQEEIIAERRRKRAEFLEKIRDKGFKGADILRAELVKIQDKTATDNDRTLAEKSYDCGYRAGMEEGERAGRSKGVLQGFIGGVLIGALILLLVFAAF